MAVTLTNPTVARKNPPGRTLFNLCAYSADWSGAEIAKAAPATGTIYVERLHVVILAAITVTIGDGESSSAVETIHWNLAGTVEGTTYDLKFKEPVALTDAKAFVADASGAGAMIINAEGFVIGS